MHDTLCSGPIAVDLGVALQTVGTGPDFQTQTPILLRPSPTPAFEQIIPHSSPLSPGSLPDTEPENNHPTEQPSHTRAGPPEEGPTPDSADTQDKQSPTTEAAGATKRTHADVVIDVPGAERIPCPICRDPLQNHNGLKRHLLRVHKTIAQFQYKCAVCGFPSPYLKKTKSCVRKHGKDPQTALTQRPAFKCQSCGHLAASARGLRKHKKNKHRTRDRAGGNTLSAAASGDGEERAPLEADENEMDAAEADAGDGGGVPGRPAAPNPSCPSRARRC